VIGDVQLQTSRDDVLVFANAFAYVPASLLLTSTKAPKPSPQQQVLM